MTVARGKLVDVEVTRYYHCISRCVRRAFLCGEGFEHRKQWIEDRLEVLAGAFAVSVCGYAVMDNHLHVLVRLDVGESAGWSEEEVVRRWLAVYGPRTLAEDDAAAVEAWVQGQLKDKGRVSELRQRLSNLGWFMKALKEPLARLANKEEGCKGTFWESRFKSIAVLDEESLLATCAYIDLNPVAAGVASTPETSRHTSLRQRVLHARSKGALKRLKAARAGSVAGSRRAGNLEQDHWLCPIEDRRRQGASREGMLEGFSLGSYMLLVDYTSRLCRGGKARVGAQVAEIFERLGTSEGFWRFRLLQLLGRERLLGSYHASNRQRLRELAQRTGHHHLDNIVPTTTPTTVPTAA